MRPDDRGRLGPAGAASALAGLSLARDERARRLAAFYALGAVAAAVVALALGGWALWLLWLTAALLPVAGAYAGFGPAVFQKNAEGRMSAAALCLLAPYLLAAWVNSRLWTRRAPAPVHIRDGVWLGRFPSAGDLAANGFAAVIDLTAELPAPTAPVVWHSFPSLDLLLPEAETLRCAAREIERCRASGPLLVCCALGYGRSAAAVATWLLMTGHCQNLTEAVAVLRAARPAVVLTACDEFTITQAAA